MLQPSAGGRIAERGDRASSPHEIRRWMVVRGQVAKSNPYLKIVPTGVRRSWWRRNRTVQRRAGDDMGRWRRKWLLDCAADLLLQQQVGWKSGRAVVLWTRVWYRKIRAKVILLLVDRAGGSLFSCDHGRSLEVRLCATVERFRGNPNRGSPRLTTECR